MRTIILFLLIAVMVPMTAHAQKSITLFPNPAQDATIVNSPAPLETIEIFDVLGKEVVILKASMNQYKIDLSPYVTGVYIVRVKSKEETVTFKLVKN